MTTRPALLIPGVDYVARVNAALAEIGAPPHIRADHDPRDPYGVSFRAVIAGTDTQTIDEALRLVHLAWKARAISGCAPCCWPCAAALSMGRRPSYWIGDDEWCGHTVDAFDPSNEYQGVPT